jgi:DNA-binding NarL/FixJ family response regulator
VLSAATDQQTVLAAIGAGAAGFIPKSSTNQVMQSALRLVLAGGKYLPTEVLSRSGGDPVASPRALSVEALGLSARQAEVLKLIAKGASNKVICRELGLAERTVKALRHRRSFVPSRLRAGRRRPSRRQSSDSSIPGNLTDSKYSSKRAWKTPT